MESRNAGTPSRLAATARGHESNATPSCSPPGATAYTTGATSRATLTESVVTASTNSAVPTGNRSPQ